MRKELSREEAFARWGKPGEELDDDWFEEFTAAVREEGQLVARHEWCGAYAGNNDVWLFRGIYISEDEVDICGPFDTFKEAADAVALFHVTTATTNIWIHPEILPTLELPSTMAGIPNRPPRSLKSQASLPPAQNANTPPTSSEVQAPSPEEQDSTPQLDEHEKAWARELEALNARLRAAGHTVTVKKPPTGEQPLVATFHNPSAKKPK